MIRIDWSFRGALMLFWWNHTSHGHDGFEAAKLICSNYHKHVNFPDSQSVSELECVPRQTLRLVIWHCNLIARAGQGLRLETRIWVFQEKIFLRPFDKLEKTT
jgi:hypothetical protein